MKKVQKKQEENDEKVVWPLRRGETGEFCCEGRTVRLPADWVFVPSGDAGLTRRLKACGDYWKVVHLRRGRVEAIGLCVPAAVREQEESKLEAERETPEYERKLEAGRRARAAKQVRYEGEFRQAVLAYLRFAPRWQSLAEELSEAVTAHAVPVGSGTVARTATLPLEVRAEAAVIAWMRHQTTAYDRMTIARVKGERREVRRRLAERSREVLAAYRRGDDVDTERCPLAQALERWRTRAGAASEKDAAEASLKSRLEDDTLDFFAEDMSPPAETAAAAETAPRLPSGPSKTAMVPRKPRLAKSPNGHLKDFFSED